MRPQTGQSRFGGPLGAFVAALAVVLAALLPGLHGLSLGGHGCGPGVCALAAGAPESRGAAKLGAAVKRSPCVCGHHHEAEPERHAPSAEPAGDDERTCATPAGEPVPTPREQHDHHNCPICKLIFTGADRFAADIAPPPLLIAAAPVGAIGVFGAVAPRADRPRDAQPRAPPAAGRALRA